MRTQRAFVTNPEIETQVIVGSWEAIEKRVKPAWLPLLERVRYEDYGRFSSEFQEYGCGVYGCVYPTHDPSVVFKITKDSTEAEFATTFAPVINEHVCVKYYAALDLGIKFKNSIHHRPTRFYALWRESAEHVGDQRLMGPEAVSLITAQHLAGHAVFKAASSDMNASAVERLADDWLSTCRAMERSPVLAPLATGIAKTYMTTGVVFGDVHPGNLGQVIRDGFDTWVITDPGKIVVIEHR